MLYDRGARDYHLKNVVCVDGREQQGNGGAKCSDQCRTVGRASYTEQRLTDRLRGVSIIQNLKETEET